jgi:hypothetical protein
LIAALEAGASRRQAAKPFGISASSAIRWHERFLEESEIAPQPPCGERPAPAIEAHTEQIMLASQARLRCFCGSCATPWANKASERASVGCGGSSPGIGSPVEAGCLRSRAEADVKAAREAWFSERLGLDPDALVFIDETATATKMARTYGRAPRSERYRLLAPHGHYKTTTVFAALRTSGIVATTLFDATIGERFRAYFIDILVLGLEWGGTSFSTS